jgi:hypothetical protein
MAVLGMSAHFAINRYLENADPFSPDRSQVNNGCISGKVELRNCDRCPLHPYRDRHRERQLNRF